MPQLRFLMQLLCTILPALFCAGVLCASSGAKAQTSALDGRVQGPPSVAELARALKNDPFEIYAWVYNNIEYEVSFGVTKGPIGTILDGRGNDEDQAALLVALLRQAGFSATYQSGVANMFNPTSGSTTITNSNSFASWLGIDPNLNGCAAINILLTAQIGTSANFQDGSATANNTPCATSNPNGSPVAGVAFFHVWVTTTINGTTYLLDPSIKSYKRSSGVNLASAMDYNRTTFISVAESGSTIDGNTPPNFVRSLNRTNLRNTLTGYANNLVSYIRQNNPAASPNDIIGGRTIAQQSVSTLKQIAASSAQANQGTPGPFVIYTSPTPFTDIPNSWRRTLNVQLSGINTTLFADAIYGHRLSVAFQPSGSNFQALLELDGVVQATGTSFQGSSTTLSFLVTDSIGGQYTGSSTLQTNGTYLIVNGWGMTGRGMVDFHRKTLNQNRLSNADTSESVLGESLSVAAYTYTSEEAVHFQLHDNVAGTRSIVLCTIGVVGIDTVGVHFDLPVAVYNSVTATATSPGRHSFFETGFFGSALEHGAIEQTVTSTGAVSTVQLMDFSTQSTDRIFSATTANYQSTVLPIIQNNYNSTDLSTIQAAITAGQRVILPENGRMRPGPTGSFTGSGWIQFLDGADQSSEGWLITGGSRGGSTEGFVPPTDFNAFQADPANFDALSIGLWQASHINSAEPIDLATGDYLYDHTDLSVGSADFPYGLAVERSYNSARSAVQGPMGLGWSHKLSVSAQVISDSWRGLGTESPIDAAAAIVATYVSYDVLNNASVPASMPLDLIVVDVLVNKWLMDQLTLNGVSVQRPGLGLQFTKLADGSYNPPLGSAESLTLVSGAFNLQMKDGTKLIYNNTLDANGKTLGGNLVSWQSPAGMTVALSYTGAGGSQILSTVTNGLGRTLNFIFSGTRISAINDSNGHSVQYAYDTTGNLTSVTDAGGNVITYKYGTTAQPTPGLLTQVFYPSFPNTPFVTNTYDSLGRVMTQADANNSGSNNTTYQYFFAGARSEELDPLGHSHVMYNNPRGRALLDIDKFGNTTSANYDALDRLVISTAPEGNSVSYTYDTRHNPLTVTSTPKPGSGLTAITQTYAYDATFNKLTSVTDGRGNQTTSVVNTTTGTLTSITQPADPAGHQPVTSFTYNGNGQVLTTTDPVGTVTQFNYDSNANGANLLSVVRDFGTGHLNLTTSFTYDAVGNQLTVTDPRGSGTTVTTTYDALRRVTKVQSPVAAIFTQNTYDADSRIIKVERNAGSTAMPVYTCNGSATSSSFRTSCVTYTPTGQKLTTTDPNGNVTSYAYDQMDRLASVTAPIDATHNAVVSYSYDARGSLLTAVNTAMSPSVTLAQYAYGANGPVHTFTSAGGSTLGYAYDGFDRLASLTYASGATERLSYDANSNVLSRITRKGDTISFAYDNLNRVTSKTSPAGNVNYSYDLVGRPLTVTDPSTSDSIPNVTSPVSPGVRYAANYTYDALSRPCAVNWNGAALVCPSTAPTIANPAITQTLTYNKANQRLQQTVSDINLLNKPTGSANQVMAVTYGTANTLNQYPTVGSATLSYDTNGNLLFDGTNTFTYDAENRLLTASNASHSASYTYDGLGRRRSKTVDGVTTVYISAGDQEMVEYAGNTVSGVQTAGQMLRHFVYADGIDEPLDMMTPSTVASPANDTHRYIVPDIGGSVLALLDPTQSGSAALVSQYGYRPFGESGDSTGAYRFTSRRLDAETGLYYYRARMYSPALGRFLQPDPIGIKGGFNLYAYVNNDPLNHTDPLGLAADAPVQTKGFGAGFTTGVQIGLAAGRPSADLEFASRNGDFAFKAGELLGNVAGPVATFGVLSKLGPATVAAPVAAEAPVVTDHVVLGLANSGLQQTATLLGGRTLLGSTNLVSDLQAVIANSSTKITLSLDGLAGSSTEAQILGAAQRGASGMGSGYTNYEIAQLYQSGRLATTNLIRGGQPVANPFAH